MADICETGQPRSRYNSDNGHHKPSVFHSYKYHASILRSAHFHPSCIRRILPPWMTGFTYVYIYINILLKFCDPPFLLLDDFNYNYFSILIVLFLYLIVKREFFDERLIKIGTRNRRLKKMSNFNIRFSSFYSPPPGSTASVYYGSL